MKEPAIMKLFAAKGAQSPLRESAGEMDSRAPLSPIAVKPRNKSPAQLQRGHSSHVHPTSQGLKKNQMPPSALSQKNQSMEYVENVTTFSPDTPEHKFATPATPKSASQKRFGWNTPRQPHEDSDPGSLSSPLSVLSLSFASLGSPLHPSFSWKPCCPDWVFGGSCQAVLECSGHEFQAQRCSQWASVW